MSLSYRSLALAIYNNRGFFTYETFPFPPASNPLDQGVGGGGSEAIAAEFGGTYRLAWDSAKVAAGTYPPAGWTAQPALNGSENWWPLGIHLYGRSEFSPNFGWVVALQGLRQNGTVGGCHACYLPPDGGDGNTARTFKYMAPTSDNGGEGGSNSWNFYLGYDYGLKKDLVVMGVGGDIRLEVRSITGSFGQVATLGPVVWNGSVAEYNAGYNFAQVKNGDHRFNIPWRGEWWIVNLSQSGEHTDRVWGFSTATPGALFTVTIPSEVQARLTAYPGNLVFAADFDSRRIIAAQADVLATPVNGRYPLLLWEVNPAPPQSWAPISLSGMYVYPPSDLSINPMTWAGGFLFNFWDHGGSIGQSVYYGSPAGTPSKYSSGGYDNWNRIYIPTATMPRTVSITPRLFNSAGVITSEFMRQKHVSYEQRGAGGRIFSHGGDISGIGDGNYNQIIVSFDPEAPTSFAIEQPEVITGKPIRPLHPDENGWQWVASRGEFWMNYMYGDNRITQTDYVSFEEWESITGGKTARAWRWNPTTKVWTTHAITPDPQNPGATWWQGDGVGGRWYHDPVTDTMVSICFNTNRAISIMKCSDYTFKQYPASRLYDGSSVMPDGRDLTKIDSRWDWLCGDDRAALDPATGMLYFWNAFTGDVYRCDTRATPYSAGGLHLPIYWCCRIPPTYQTRNKTHFAWAKGALWIIQEANRFFSWAPGDPHAYEHDVGAYPGFGAQSLCTYSVGGDERLLAFGGQGPYQYKQRSAAIAARQNYWYTITLG